MLYSHLIKGFEGFELLSTGKEPGWYPSPVRLSYWMKCVRFKNCHVPPAAVEGLATLSLMFTYSFNI